MKERGKRVLTVRAERLIFLLAIFGDLDNLDMWHDIWSCGGTTIPKFVVIIRRIIGDIDPSASSRRHYFTFDNLSAHLHNQVMVLIYQVGHRVVPRAPYWPVDCAVEYVFNTLQVLLRNIGLTENIIKLK